MCLVWKYPWLFYKLGPLPANICPGSSTGSVFILILAYRIGKDNRDQIDKQAAKQGRVAGGSPVTEHLKVHHLPHARPSSYSTLNCLLLGHQKVGLSVTINRSITPGLVHSTQNLFCSKDFQYLAIWTVQLDQGLSDVMRIDRASVHSTIGVVCGRGNWREDRVESRHYQDICGGES